MPYFFIIPAFVLRFVALCAASVVAYLLPSLKPWRSHCVGVLLWSTIGFVLTTALYAVAAATLFGGLEKLLDGEASVAGGIAMGLMVFVVPFVAAAVGVFGGAALGWRRAQRKTRA